MTDIRHLTHNAIKINQQIFSWVELSVVFYIISISRYCICASIISSSRRKQERNRMTLNLIFFSRFDLLVELYPVLFLIVPVHKLNIFVEYRCKVNTIRTQTLQLLMMEQFLDENTGEYIFLDYSFFFLLLNNINKKEYQSTRR